MLLPVLARTEETGWQVGGLKMHVNDETDSRTYWAGLATENKQFLLKWQYHQPHQYRLGVSTEYWPANVYTSNDDSAIAEKYTLQRQSIKAKRLRPLNFAHYKTRRKTPYQWGFEVLANYDEIEWSTSQVNQTTDEGFSSLFGLLFQRDTRSHIDWPTHGNFLESKVSVSTHNYTQVSTAWSYFTPMPAKSVLALKSSVSKQYGNVPFLYQLSPDGDHILRGAENGRFRTKQLISLQAEWRQPLFWRLSSNIFADFVFIDEQYTLLKSFGIGGRFAALPEKKINLRADIGMINNDLGFVINLGEAF